MIKEDLLNKIKAISERMDEQLRAGNYQDYNRLADTYLKLIREYEALSKPKQIQYDWMKPQAYFTTDAVSKYPLKQCEIINKTEPSLSPKNLTVNVSADAEIFKQSIAESLCKSIKIEPSK